MTNLINLDKNKGYKKVHVFTSKDVGKSHIDLDSEGLFYFGLAFGTLKKEDIGDRLYYNKKECCFKVITKDGTEW